MNILQQRKVLVKTMPLWSPEMMYGWNSIYRLSFVPFVQRLAEGKETINHYNFKQFGYPFTR